MLARTAFALTLAAVACDGYGNDGGTGPPGAVVRILYGIDSANTLIRFANTAPGTITRSVGVTGLRPGERIVGIDFRPADGKLYALGDSSRLYTLDTLTGAATAVDTTFTPALFGSQFGFGINPVTDELRVHSDSDQNLRLSPVTGAVTGVDTPIGWDTSDVNAGTAATLAGSAYTNSASPPPAATVLYAIETTLDILVTVGNPITGRLITVGSLGAVTNGFVGFDIVGADGTAYATFTAPGGGASRLNFINLGTGSATFVGVVGGGAVLRSIAVAP